MGTSTNLGTGFSDSFTYDITDKAEAINEVLKNGRILKHVSEKLKRDKDVVLFAVSNDGSALQYAPTELRGDPEIVLAALQSKGVGGLKYATMRSLMVEHDRLRGNAEIVMAAVSKYGWGILEYAASNLRDDEAFFKTLREMEEGLRYASARSKSQKDLTMQATSLDKLNKTGDADQPVARSIPPPMLCSFMHASETLKNDLKVVMDAVSADGMSLQYASKSMKADERVIRCALRSGGIEVLKHASHLVKDNRSFLECLVDEYGARGQLLKFASIRLKAHKAFIKCLVSKDGLNLADVATSLQDNQEIVEAAIKEDWKALQFASEDLRNNKKIVSLAVRLNPRALEFASDELRSDKQFILAALKERDFSVLSYAAPSLQDDEFFFQSLFDAHGVPGLAIQYASERLKNNKELVLLAVSKNGKSLYHVAKNLQNDGDVVRAAILQEGKAAPSLRDDEYFFQSLFDAHGVPGLAIQYASDRLKNNKVLVLSAVSKDGTSLKYASENLKNDGDVVRAAVLQNGKALQYASEDLLNNKNFVSLAVGINPRALEFASDEFRKARAISVVSKDWTSLRYVAEHLKNDKDVVRAAKTCFMADLCQNGNLLELAPECFRMDEECVLAAISSQPGVLRFALGGLNQDPKCLIKAGLWDAEHESYRQKRKIVLSTRFSLAAESSPTATEFTVLLKKHPYFRNPAIAFQVYSPNAFNKQTCDPKWTDMEWECRGTKETCRMKDKSLCEGPPRDECCWRYSYRCHLAEAKASRGFMIQVVEHDRRGYEMCKIGKGQAIERVMAEQVGTKVFVVNEPGVVVKDSGSDMSGMIWLSRFREGDIDRLAKHVEEWYASGCEDMRLENVLCR